MRSLSIGHEHELLQKLESAGLTPEMANKIITAKGNSVAKKVIDLLKNELVVINNQKPTISEIQLDFKIQVDRSVKPSYPHWRSEIIHKDFESLGLSKYDLRSLYPWRAEYQRNNVVVAMYVYEQLCVLDLIKYSIGLSDLLAIQSKGIKVFRNLYKGKTILGWKSVIANVKGILSAPFLFEHDNKLVLEWKDLKYDDVDANCITLLFAKVTPGFFEKEIKN